MSLIPSPYPDNTGEAIPGIVHGFGCFPSHQLFGLDHCQVVGFADERENILEGLQGGREYTDPCQVCEFGMRVKDINLIGVVSRMQDAPFHSASWKSAIELFESVIGQAYAESIYVFAVQFGGDVGATIVILDTGEIASVGMIIGHIKDGYLFIAPADVQSLEVVSQIFYDFVRVHWCHHIRFPAN